MKKRTKACLALLALVLVCGALLGWFFSGGTQVFYKQNGALSAGLQKYGINGANDLSIGEWESFGVEQSGSRFTTLSRTVSHGDIYTAWARVPIRGEFHKGDTVIVYFEAKNAGPEETNFLVDLYSDEARTSWLTRTPIFAPGSGWMPCWFYGVAAEDTDTLYFELTLGWAAQSVEITNLKAAAYPGTVREELLEQLPNMSRTGRSRTLWPDWSRGDAQWRDTAQEMIESNRTGEFTVQVVDANGKPVDNASVQIAMTDHDYLFGTAVGGWGGYGSEGISDYFNTVTIANDLKWDEGDVKERAHDALLGFKEAGLKVHGHVLFWPATDRDPYDDGVEHTSEFITTPQFVVRTVHVIQAMQKMTDPKTGYGDGTIKTLRTELDAALAQYEADLAWSQDPVNISHLNACKDICLALQAAIADKAEEDTSLDGVTPSLADFQQLLRRIVLEHVSHFAEYYTETGAIVEWDAMNELFNLGNRGVTNALGEDLGTYDGVSVATSGGAFKNEIFVEVLQAADEASGGLPLSLNDVSWQANARQREWTYNFLHWLKEQNAPISFLGLQAYMGPMNIRAFISPEEAWVEYDKLWELGIQTEITEYGFSGFEGLALSDQQAKQVMADFMLDYITMNYAHPGSRGFIAWGGIPTWGPVSSAYYKLVYSDLWTNETVTTDKAGQASVRGYLGSYEITVTDEDGKAVTVEAELLATDGKTVVVTIP